MSLIALGKISEAIIYFGRLFKLYLKDYVDINKAFGESYAIVDMDIKRQILLHMSITEITLYYRLKENHIKSI